MGPAHPDRPYLSVGFALLCIGILVPLAMFWWVFNDTMQMPDITSPAGDPIVEGAMQVGRTRDLLPVIFGAYAIGGVSLVGGAILTIMGLIQFNHRLRSAERIGESRPPLGSPQG